MKKSLIVLSIILVLSLSILLVGCSQNIEYSEEIIDDLVGVEIEDNSYMQTITQYGSVEEFEKFLNISKLDILKLDFSKFDSEYFEQNALLVVCLAGHKNIRFSIEKVFVKNNELFVSINSEKLLNTNYSNYKFLTIKRNLLKGINKYSYIIKT